VPAERPGPLKRTVAIGFGLALFARSQFARSRSTLEKTYIDELGLANGEPVRVTAESTTIDVSVN
jgi:hypothetical protein